MNAELINSIGAGFHCIDIIHADSRQYIALGGTAANVSAILSSFSQNTSLLCPQYTDLWGEWFQQELLNRCIRPLYFSKTKSSTPRLIENLNTKNGLHSFQAICPLCGKELSKGVLPSFNSINDEIVQQANQSNVFFFDRVSPGIKNIVNKHYSSWNYYEPNTCRNYNSFLEIAKSADIIKFSSSRIYGTYINRLIEDLQLSNVQIIIVTNGASGFSFSYRDKNGQLTNWEVIESAHIDSFLDSSGAGDWFSASFLLTFLRSYPNHVDNIDYDILDYALNTAKEVASIKCGFIGVHGIYKNTKALNKISHILNVHIRHFKDHPFSWGPGCNTCGLI